MFHTIQASKRANPSVLARTGFLASALMLVGVLEAAAIEQVVNLRSLKLSAPKNRLTLSADDPAIPFPEGLLETTLDVTGVAVVIYTREHPGGVWFVADSNTPGQRPAWRLKTGKQRRWIFGARAVASNSIRRFSLGEDGRMKVDGVGAAAALLTSPGPVHVGVGGVDWGVCARFEQADIVEMVPGESLTLGPSTGSVHLLDCSRPIFEGCGDGDLDGGEACDDYNAVSGDGCSATCTTEICGDGILNPQEDCDDGNNDDGDGCDADCAICGSNKTAGAEDCDPPYAIGGERLCGDDCRLAVCGDGVVEAGENCENSPGLDTACPGQCGQGGVLPCSCPSACGNGVVDGVESCDPHAPSSSWSCPSTDEYFAPISCGLPNRGAGCECCNFACGIGGLGCCESAGCGIGPQGFGICTAVERCIVDEGCSEGLSCDVSTNTCCIAAGDTSHACSVLGAPTGVCCPGSTCSDGGIFGFCE